MVKGYKKFRRKKKQYEVKKWFSGGCFRGWHVTHVGKNYGVGAFRTKKEAKVTTIRIYFFSASLLILVSVSANNLC